jgi:hypothetical protein
MMEFLAVPIFLALVAAGIEGIRYLGRLAAKYRPDAEPEESEAAKNQKVLDYAIHKAGRS